jgi:hypothetical protein
VLHLRLCAMLCGTQLQAWMEFRAYLAARLHEDHIVLHIPAARLVTRLNHLLLATLYFRIQCTRCSISRGLLCAGDSHSASCSTAQSRSAADVSHSVLLHIHQHAGCAQRASMHVICPACNASQNVTKISMMIVMLLL